MAMFNVALLKGGVDVGISNTVGVMISADGCPVEIVVLSSA